MPKAEASCSSCTEFIVSTLATVDWAPSNKPKRMKTISKCGNVFAKGQSSVEIPVRYKQL